MGASKPSKELNQTPSLRQKSGSAPSGTLWSVSSFGRIVRRALLEERTLKLIVWSNRAYLQLAKGLQTQQADLGAIHRPELTRGNVTLDGLPTKQIQKTSGTPGFKDRYQSLLKFRREIHDFRRKVGREEQPCQRVKDLVDSARRREVSKADVPEFELDQTILQTRASLLGRLLAVRCDLIIINDYVSTWENTERTPSKPNLDVNFAANRFDGNKLTETDEKTQNLL